MRQRLLAGLHAFNAASSVAGGIGLMGGGIQMTEWVRHTDFASLYFPGVILFAIVGGSSVVALLALLKQTDAWRLMSIIAGVVMIFWIVGEIISIQAVHVLQAIYAATGVVVIWLTPSRMLNAKGDVYGAKY